MIDRLFCFYRKEIDPMTDEIRELQETFGDKMKALKRFTYYKAGKNDDLQQEALLATWTGLLKDPNATPADPHQMANPWGSQAQLWN